MRKPVIAGNWKMYKTIAEAVDFIEKIKPVAAKADHCEVVVAPPFTALAAAAQAAKGSKVCGVRAGCALGQGRRAHRRHLAGDAGGRRLHARDHRPLRAPPRSRRNRRAGEPQAQGGAGGGPYPHRVRRRNAGGARIRPHRGSTENPVRGRISRIDPFGLFPYHNCLRAGVGDWHGPHRNAGDGGGNAIASCASWPGRSSEKKKRAPCAFFTAAA